MAFALVIIAMMTTAACSSDGRRGVPTEEEARAALDMKFRQARAGDAEVFCGDTEIPDMCVGQWERLGGVEGVPEEMPEVVSTRQQDGYRVLRVCGTDGRGVPYRTDFVVGI